ncbi:MAG TPA: hypothetical protein PLG43_09250 [Spirochaetia bacterium]|nr:hypothetical protein [Spirochaetia bacterium]
MRFHDIAEALHCTVYNKGRDYATADIEFIIAGDLMNDVLMVDRENVLLLTSLTSDQVIYTADIVEALGILLVNDKQPLPGMRKLAEDFDVTLLSTSLPMFESCAALHTILSQKAEPAV